MLTLNARLSRKSLSESVYDAILENILNGSLAAGTELSEVALAEALHVSRTPVHEAAGRLLKEGLLVLEPPRRLLVARFTRDDVAEIYEMRLLLETAAARQAAARMKAPLLDSLRAEAAALDRDREALDWSSRALDFDQRFHAAIAEASGNRRLQADIARYRLLARAFCRLTGTPAQLLAALHEHQAILASLANKSAAGAARAAAQHVEARFRTVLDTLFPEGA